MKTAKRVLAILMAMLMTVSVFTVAASAAGALQTKIDNAVEGETVSIDANTKESVTIDKNLTIDLGGKILKSANGSPAITVKNGATVTVQNGYVESYYTAYSGATDETLKILSNITRAPAGIMAYGSGTTVILNDVRVLGGLVRIPKTTEWFVPAGSAVKVYGGAGVELNNAVLVGSYAVSNDPANTGRADGTVTVNDAIMIGYIDYVKRVYNGLVYDEATVEKVNAADRIVGILNSQVHLESYEMDLLDKILDDRAYIFTTKPTDADAIVTINENTGFATITAAQVKDLKNTDCSYKYVPKNAYDVETGETFALNTEYPASKLEGKEIRINYRLDFQLKGDFKKIADKIRAGEFDALYNKYYAKAIVKADSMINAVLNTYNSKLNDIVKIYDAVAEAGGEPLEVFGQTYSAADAIGDDFYAILRGLLSLGGVTLYNKTNTAKQTGAFTTMKFSKDDPLYAQGTKAPTDYEVDETTAEPSYLSDWTPVTVYDVTRLGTLDKVEALKNEFLAIKGSSIGTQANWVDLAHFVVDNYQAVLDIVTEAKTNVDALYTLFTDTNGRVGQIVQSLEMQKELNMLKSIKNALSDADKAINKALENGIVDQVKAKVDAHANDGTIETYVGKAINMINNYRQYVTPEALVTADEDGTLLQTYYVSGPTRVETILKAKLHVRAFGGSVNFTTDTAPAAAAKTEKWTDVSYNQIVTLNAVPNNGMEFLYYMNPGSDRILSTNPTYVVNTQMERYIEAVFESAGSARVIFTDNSGGICDTLGYADTVDASDIEMPTLSGYAPTGWGPNGTAQVTSADYTSSYAVGSSAFEVGAVYNAKGYAFKLNSTTANKYLVTPKFEIKGEFSIYFNDGNDRWGNDAVRIANQISYTAKGDNFSYWTKDGVPVSVYKTYNVTAVNDAEFTAVYGADDVKDAYVTLPVARMEDDRALVYGECSVAPSRQVLSFGLLVSFTDAAKSADETAADALIKSKVNGSDVFASISTKKINQNIMYVAVRQSTMAQHEGVCHVRAFVELKTATGSEFIYSDVFDYPPIAPAG